MSSTAEFSIFDSEAGNTLDFERLAGTSDTSWQRGKPSEADIRVISSFGFKVRLPEGDWHVVALARDNGDFVGACDCKGYEYNAGPCAHLCTVRKAAWTGVDPATDINGRTIRIHRVGEPDLSMLPEKQREAFEAVELGDTGVREYQRQQGYSSPGTVSNHLRAAREKLTNHEEQLVADGGRDARRDPLTDDRRVGGEVIDR